MRGVAKERVERDVPVQCALTGNTSHPVSQLVTKHVAAREDNGAPLRQETGGPVRPKAMMQLERNAEED